MYRINSNHEFQKFLKSKLLFLTHKTNLSVKETELKDKEMKSDDNYSSTKCYTTAKERIISLFLALIQCSRTYYFMVKRNGWKRRRKKTLHEQ